MSGMHPLGGHPFHAVGRAHQGMGDASKLLLAELIPCPPKHFWKILLWKGHKVFPSVLSGFKADFRSAPPAASRAGPGLCVSTQHSSVSPLFTSSPLASLASHVGDELGARAGCRSSHGYPGDAQDTPPPCTLPPRSSPSDNLGLYNTRATAILYPQGAERPRPQLSFQRAA